MEIEKTTHYPTEGNQGNCTVCGEPEVKRLKYNGGRPTWLWLPNCNCVEEALMEYLNRKYKKR